MESLAFNEDLSGGFPLFSGHKEEQEDAASVPSLGFSELNAVQ